MKKILSYIAIATLASISLASCVRENMADSKKGDLTIKLVCNDLVDTKTAGDDTYGENTIDHWEYFFFSDAKGETLLHHGRITDGSITLSLETKEGGDYADLRKGSYLYIIANYSDDLSSYTKLDDILALPIQNATDSVFTNFVMDTYNYTTGDKGKTLTKSYMVKLSPKAVEEERAETVYLSRVAAKFQLNIAIPNTVEVTTKEQSTGESTEGTTEESTTRTWKAETNTLIAYMWNCLSYATVKGDSLARDSKTEKHFFSYDQKHPYTATENEAGDSTNVVCVPFYTYPQYFEQGDNGEPFFNISLKWTNDEYGTNETWYKVTFPGLTSVLRNRLYTMDVTLATLGGTQDDFVKMEGEYYVSDWFSPDATSGAGVVSPRYLYVLRDTVYVYSEDAVTVAVASSHNIVTKVDSASHYNYYKDTKEEISDERWTLTTTNDDEGNHSFTLECPLDLNPKDDNYDISRILYKVIIGQEDTGIEEGTKGLTDTVYVMQYPAAYITHTQSNGKVFVNGQYYDADSGFNLWGYSVFAYDSNLPTKGTVLKNDDYYYSETNSLGGVMNPDKITGEVTSNNNKYLYTIHVTVLPESNGYSLGDPRARPNDYGDKGFENPSEGNLGYKTFTGWTISRSGSNYKATANSGTEWEKDDNMPYRRYRPTSTVKNDMVSPAFIMGSSYGKCAVTNYDNAHDRCAAYQESGYPAGRWRLPTVAEIAYVTDISDYKHIPNLFQTGKDGSYEGYWAAGYIAYLGDAGKEAGFSYNGIEGAVYLKDATGGVDIYGSNTLTLDGNTFAISTRCVYDTWYWGEEPVSQFLETWGGYQMGWDGSTYSSTYINE